MAGREIRTNETPRSRATTHSIMTDSPFRLRAAAPADASAIARLLAELGYPTAPSDVPQRLAAVHAEGGAVLLALDGDETPLGLISLTQYHVLHAPGPVAYITALVTTAGARGRGVGRALVQAAFEWAQARRCVRLSVTSAEHRADAHAFYPKCGLPFTGRRFSANVPS